MKHKLNSFSGAFEGTTKGLEGIANALKREEPIPPDTNYPRYLLFWIDDNQEFRTILQITSPNSCSVVSSFDSAPHDWWCDNGNIYWIDDFDRDYSSFDEWKTQHPDWYANGWDLKFNLTTFEITENGNATHSEWIDSSTLPPQ